MRKRTKLLLVFIGILVIFLVFKQTRVISPEHEQAVKPSGVEKSSGIQNRSGSSDFRYQDEMTLEGSVSGSVFLFKDNSPVSDAEIVITNNGAFTLSVKTDSSGQFSAENLPFGTLLVKVTKSGLGTRFRNVQLTRANPMADLRFLMIPEGSVFGRVTYESGDPADHVDVQIQMGFQSGHVLHTFTDPDGQYQISGITPGRDYELSVILSGGFMRTIYITELDPGESSGPHDFILKPCVTVVGIITDEKTGDPVFGAEVMLIPQDHNSRKTVSVTSDDTGVYRHECVPVKYAELFVDAPGYWNHSEEIILDSAEPVLQMDYRLKPAATLRGKVVNKDQEPVEDLQVKISSRINKNRITETEITDIDGSFVFESICSRGFTIHGILDGIDMTMNPTGISDIKPGDVLEKTFTLDSKVHRISGVVIDRSQIPLDDVAITSGRYSNNAEPFGGQVIYTDEEGRFTLENIQERYVLKFEKEGYASHEEYLGPDRFAKPELTLSIVLDRAMKISGRVEDHLGHPLENISISVPRYQDNQSSVKTLSDWAGKFEITGLTPGNYLVNAFREVGYPAERGSWQKYMKSDRIDLWGIPAGTDDLIITFKSKGAVVVCATDKITGESIEKYTVKITANNLTEMNTQPRYSACISEDGCIEVPNVLFGELHISVYDYHNRDVELGSETVYLKHKNTPLQVDIEADLNPDYLEGYVYGKDRDDPLNNFYIRASLHGITDPRQNVYLQSRTDSTGLFQMKNFQPGTWDFTGFGYINRKSIQYTETLEIQNIETPVEFFVLVGKGPLYGSVVDGVTGAGIPGAVVRSFEEGKFMSPRSAITDTTGNFTIQDCPLDKSAIIIHVTHDDFAAAKTNIADPRKYTSQESPLIISLGSGAIIRGHLRDEGGLYMGLARLSLSESRFQNLPGESRLHIENKHHQTTTDAEGFFEFTCIAPGEYDIAYAPGMNSIAWIITVNDTSEKRLDLQIRNGVTVSGTVTLDGKPVPDVNFYFSTMKESAIGSGYFIVMNQTTGSVGKFSFNPVPPGTYSLILPFTEIQWTIEVGETDVEFSPEITEVDYNAMKEKM